MPVMSRPQKMAIKPTSRGIRFKGLKYRPNSGKDAPMRIFSQPSNIVSAKVDSNKIRHLQKKRRVAERGGL